MSSPRQSDDPFTLKMRPPTDETPAERTIRLKNEREAKAENSRITDQLNAEREEIMATMKNTYKLLLLGQSDSGKSTLLRQFQLMFDPDKLENERRSWLPVIHLNIIRATRLILEALEWKQSSDDNRRNSIAPGIPDGYSSDEYSEPSTVSFDALPTLRTCILPLLNMETVLAKRLGMDVQVGGRKMVFAKNGWQDDIRRSSTFTEVTIDDDVHSFDSRTVSAESVTLPSSPAQGGQRNQGRREIQVDIDIKTARILESCKAEILILWTHPWLPELLKKRRFQLEESSEFFMSQLDRIARPDYMPDINDILRARLRTMGVVEHVFRVPLPPGNQILKWKLYDVGGSRGQRASWVPYFDDARAIIFFAPISAFDQYLEEDSRCNRVEDSLQLFKYIANHPLLFTVHLVVFLNKTDVLRKKLESGIKYVDTVKSYGKRPNDETNVSEYFKTHFRQIHKKAMDTQKGPPTREFYCHLTTVIDIQATRDVIEGVRTAIARTHLRDSVFL